MKNKTPKPESEPKLSPHSHIPPQQLAQIKAAFDLFDTDQGGFIDSKELKQAMVSLGYDTKNYAIFSMICDLDADGNGVISFDEWVGLMTNKATVTQSRDHSRKVFKLFDNQNSGFICANRLQEVARQIGQEVSFGEIVEMLKRADLDVDGLISEEEFYQIVTRKVKD